MILGGGRMKVSYEKLHILLGKKGETLHSLKQKGVITGYTSQAIPKGKGVNIDQIANICRYFDVPIEEVVEVIRD